MRSKKTNDARPFVTLPVERPKLERLRKLAEELSYKDPARQYARVTYGDLVRDGIDLVLAREATRPAPAKDKRQRALSFDVAPVRWSTPLIGWKAVRS